MGRHMSPSKVPLPVEDYNYFLIIKRMSRYKVEAYVSSSSPDGAS